MASQEQKLRLVLAFSLLASVGGIAYAVCCGTAPDGQRGGALAVAASLLALFAARDTPAAVLEQGRIFDKKLVLEHGTPLERIDLLRVALAAMVDGQRLEKKYLTWSSGIGTLVWGFGDWIARWFGAAG